MAEADTSHLLVPELNEVLGGLDAEDLLHTVIADVFPGRICVASSFGAEAAVLLDIVARVDRSTPVIFLDTGMLFAETLAYRDALQQRLGLTDIRVVHPDGRIIAAADPEGTLWQSSPDACCALRKVLPLDDALRGFDAWITGRKRHHRGDRSELPLFEAVDGRAKINPLTGWSQERIDSTFARRQLPPHPLVAEGFPSIGCRQCTRRVEPGEDTRAGRWAGMEKTECGIHKAPWYGRDGLPAAENG